MAGHLLMGIDVGTFSSKGVLCSPDAKVMGEHQIEHTIVVPRPGWAEQDADAIWWHDVCEISQALLSKAAADSTDVSAVAISALGADLVPLDAKGRALRPAILYGIDTRSMREVDDLNKRFGPDEMAKTTGHYLSAQSIGPKMLWLKRNEPEVWRRARYLCSASTFLVYRLTGEYIFDYPTAAWFDPLFDLGRLNWNEKYVNALVGDKSLPTLQWVGQVAGKVTQQASLETGLAQGTSVTTGTLDAVAEAISVGVYEPGDLMVMYGSTTFFIHVIHEALPVDGVLWHAPYVSPGLYALEAGTATTGAATRWFRDRFAKPELAAQAAGGKEAYMVLNEEASKIPPGSCGLVILPYFSGERTPISDPDARGAILGLNLIHERAHLYRAMLEATAYAVRHNLETINAFGLTPRRTIAVGGGARSELLLQIVSDVTGVQQELPVQTIGASYGDAFIAGLAMGLLPMSALQSQWVRIRRRFDPNPRQHELYKGFYQVYRDLYPQTSSSMHALARLSSQMVL
jgi:xylulokinase